MLVRAASLGRLEARRREWNDRDSRVVAVVGDIGQPAFGISADDMARIRGRVGHFFHVAGLYDMSATDADLAAHQRRRHGGSRRRRGREWARRVSTTSARSRRPGATPARSARTCSRRPSASTIPTSAPSTTPSASCASTARFRGASTGRRSSSDIRSPARWTRWTAPTTCSPLSSSSPRRCRRSLPLPGIEGGTINLVPVDFVAAAIDHIAHREGLDGTHLPSRRPRAVQRRRHAQHLRRSRRCPALLAAHAGRRDRAGAADPALSRSAGVGAGKALEDAVGIPLRALDYVSNPTTFDCSQTTAALAGSGIRVPPPRHLRAAPVAVLAAAPATRTPATPRNLERPCAARPC